MNESLILEKLFNTHGSEVVVLSASDFERIREAVREAGLMPKFQMMDIVMTPMTINGPKSEEAFPMSQKIPKPPTPPPTRVLKDSKPVKEVDDYLDWH
jgi:hypothetical protein